MTAESGHSTRSPGPRTLLERLVQFEARQNCIVTMDIPAAMLTRTISDADWNVFLKAARYINIRLARIVVEEDARRDRWMAVVEGRESGPGPLPAGMLQPYLIQPFPPEEPLPSREATLEWVEAEPEDELSPEGQEDDPEPVSASEAKPARRERTAAEGAAAHLVLGSLAFVGLYSLAPLGQFFPIAGAMALGAFAGVAIGRMSVYLTRHQNEIVRAGAGWLAESRFRNANMGAFAALYMVFLRPALQGSLVSAAMVEWAGFLMISFYVLWRSWLGVTAATEEERAARTGFKVSGTVIGDEEDPTPPVGPKWRRHNQVIESLPDRFALALTRSEERYLLHDRYSEESWLSVTRFLERVVNAMDKGGTDIRTINNVTTVLLDGLEVGQMGNARGLRYRAAAIRRANQILNDSNETGSAKAVEPDMTKERLAAAADEFVVTGKRDDFVTAVILAKCQFDPRDGYLTERIAGLASGAYSFSDLCLGRRAEAVIQIVLPGISARRRRRIADEFLDLLGPKLEDSETAGGPDRRVVSNLQSKVSSG